VNKIQGQPSLFLLDLKGKEYPAIAEVNRKKRVNGQREISLSFLYEDINADFLHNIEFGWKILFKGEWYTITSPTYALDGDVFSVGVDAVLSFFVDMNGHYLQDKVEDKSKTPASFFRELFKGTGYGYVLVDNLAANTLNYQANQSKTERFLYGIDRFKGEYIIRGKQAYIHGLIGSDKDVVLHEDLNIKDVSIEVDGSGFHTWAKGFGDKDDTQENADYKLNIEYVSPLVAKHGYIEGPAIRDGSYKHADALTEAVKKQVENSYKISTTITAVDLTNNGYPEMQFEEGDRVFLYVTDLKQNQQVRVVEIDETFDWEGNIIDAQYTVGNEGIAARYKTQQYDIISDFRDIQSGKKTLEFNWLPEAIKRASDIINGNIDSHFKYGAGEIIGINKSNPNGYMRFNTDGLGFSRDGGKTYRSAITYEGIVADAITTGTLRSILIESVDIFGSRFYSESDSDYMEIVGGNIELVQNNGRKLDIGPSGFYGYNQGGSTRFQADRSLVTSAALGTSNYNVYLAAEDSGDIPGEVRAVKTSTLGGGGSSTDYEYIDIRSRSIKSAYGRHFYIGTDAGELRVMSQGLLGSGVYRDIRANKLFANEYETNGGNILYLRASSRVRVYGTGSSSSLSDIEVGRVYANVMITNTDNAYVGTNGELRVVNKGLSEIYRDVRASGFLGTSISLSSSAENAVNFHVRPAGDGEVHITSRSGSGSFRPVRASSFEEGSLRENKKNIVRFDEDVLSTIKTNGVYTYHMNEQGDEEKKKLGVMVNEAPDIVKGESLETVSLYPLTSYVYRGVQQLAHKDAEQDGRILALEEEIKKLKGVI